MRLWLLFELAATAACARALPLGAQQNFNTTAAVRASMLADRLLACNFVNATGTFDFEGLWQSGNTLETLAYLCSGPAAAGAPPGLCSRVRAAFTAAFALTPVIVDNCFDDHQWWGLAWVRGYELTGNISYLKRGYAVWNFTMSTGWDDVCGGGVDWCPTSGSNKPYKNAITIELFLALTMDLNRHAAVLGLPESLFAGWGTKAWAWQRGSGMVNSHSLVNDGLDGNTCTNNGQTTWTYNQGTFLDALVALGATGDSTAAAAAAAVAAAAMTTLSPGGVLHEPCSGSCDGDQQLFKGIFVRHLARAAAAPAAPAPLAASAGPFIAANARSMLANAACAGGGYGLDWAGRCTVDTVATFSSALDLLTAAAATLAGADTSAWVPLGGGACTDAAGASMPACVADVSEAACATAAAAPALSSPAYDVMTSCLGVATCRIRTLAGAGSCPPGFTWHGGPATDVTTTDGASLTLCVLKATS